MDFNELFLKVLIEQAAKTTLEFIPREFQKLFSGKKPRAIVKNFLSGYFYHEDFVKSLLYAQDWSAKLGHTDFIDYDICNDYYPEDKKQISLQLGEQHKSILFPFKEEINFVLHPKVQIIVRGLKPYSLPSKLEKLTEPNLQRFLVAKPNTFDGPNLRLSSLKKLSKGNYECELESASYFP